MKKHNIIKRVGVVNFILIFLGAIWGAVVFVESVGREISAAFGGSSLSGSYMGLKIWQIEIIPLIFFILVVVFSVISYFFNLSKFKKNVFFVIFLVFFLGGITFSYVAPTKLLEQKRESREERISESDEVFAKLSMDYFHIRTVYEETNFFLSHNKKNGCLFAAKDYSDGNKNITLLGKIIDDKLIVPEKIWSEPDFLSEYLDEDGINFSDKYKNIYDENINLKDCYEFLEDTPFELYRF